MSTGKATKKVLKTCQLAIPCQLEHPQFLEALDAQGKDRLLLVLLTSSCQQQEAGVTMTVYTIKDIISEDDAVEFAQLPKNEMLQVRSAVLHSPIIIQNIQLIWLSNASIFPGSVPMPRVPKTTNATLWLWSVRL